MKITTENGKKRLQKRIKDYAKQMLKSGVKINGACICTCDECRKLDWDKRVILTLDCEHVGIKPYYEEQMTMEGYRHVILEGGGPDPDTKQSRSGSGKKDWRYYKNRSVQRNKTKAT